MDSVADLTFFVERFVSSITSFTNAVFDFMTYEIAVWDNVTIFEVLFGIGLSSYLVASVVKWLVSIVT